MKMQECIESELMTFLELNWLPKIQYLGPRDPFHVSYRRKLSWGKVTKF